MMADNYTKAEAQLDFRDISGHIEEENLEGAAITNLLMMYTNILRSPLD